MFRDKNILMATQIWCWVGCCWKQRLCSRTRWNNYCTKPRNATSLRNASAKSSAIWRSQAGRPTSPTSQAGYLPTSVYLSEKALLGGAIGPSWHSKIKLSLLPMASVPSALVALSSTIASPWCSVLDKALVSATEAAMLSTPCLSLPAAHLMLLNSLWLTFFTLALPCFSRSTSPSWFSSHHRELLMVLNDSLSSFGLSWFIYLLNNLTLLQFQHSTQYFLHVTVSHIICTMRRAKSIYHVPNPFNIIQLQTCPQMADIPRSEKWKYNMFLWIKVQHGQARKGSGFSILDMLSIICWQFFLSWKDKFEHNVKISGSLSCWCYCAP